MPRLNELEKKVCEAHLNSLTIRDYTNSDYQNLCFELLAMCKIIGQKEPPMTSDVISWVLFIGRNYKNIRSKEISHAFEMALTGKLTTEDSYGKPIKLSAKFYNNINLEYICNILTAYNDYRIDKMKTYNRLKIEKDWVNGEAEREKARIEESIQIVKKRLRSAFKLAEDGDGDSIEDPMNLLYNRLDRSGLIKLDREDRLEIYSIAEEQYTEELFKESKKQMKSTERKKVNTLIQNMQEQNTNFKSKVKSRAKLIGLRTQIINWCFDDVQIENIIEKLSFEDYYKK